MKKYQNPGFFAESANLHIHFYQKIFLVGDETAKRVQYKWHHHSIETPYWHQNLRQKNSNYFELEEM